MSRRRFLRTGAAVILSSTAYSRRSPAAPTTRGEPSGYFAVASRGGRWWLITPEGNPFFSVGLNHIDASPLRYQENGDLWQRKYGNSMERWIKESVRPDLIAWGFNSVGWVQEVVTIGLKNHRHSPSFTFEEYQWLDMPYCHQLPFADFHQWEVETRHADFSSRDFEDWCDYVARSQCARMARDRKLIGYFYVDCPTWVHVRPGNEWKGPLFDPERLKTGAGREELHRLATRYYQVTRDSIRRYDRHHLILGDRYEANAPLPVEVVKAAIPSVDVLSFQDFRDPVAHLGDWHRVTEKPVLWADGAFAIPVEDPHYAGGRYLRNSGSRWGEVLLALRNNPGCVGAHLCGAYLRNRARKRALLDERGQPDEENVSRIAAANRSMTKWVEEQTVVKQEG